jgi:hypothetical protein
MDRTGLQKLLKVHGFKIVDFVYRGGIFSALLCIWRNIPRDLLGGSFQSTKAKVLYPIITLHFILCLILTPIAVFLDKLDKKKQFSVGYIVPCQKQP